METNQINAMIESQEEANSSFFTADDENFIQSDNWKDNSRSFYRLARDLSKLYEELRQDLNVNSGWSDSECSNRWARLYYELASFLDEHFGEYQIGLECIDECLKRCFERLSKVSIQVDTRKLEKTATILQKLTKINLTTTDGFIEGRGNQEISAEYTKCAELMESLKVINTLEHKWTQAEREDAELSIKYRCQLGNYWKLVGKPDLAKQYMNEKEIITTLNRDQNESSHSGNNQIDDIISNEILEHKSSLSEVKSYIQNVFRKPLQGSDIFYVERKYLENCQNFWLDDVIDDLQSLNEHNLNDLFNKINNVKSLEPMLDLFKTLKYTQLLFDHISLMSELDKKNLVQRSRTLCLEYIKSHCESIEIEIHFLDSFVSLLSSSKFQMQYVIEKLMLKHYYLGDITFNKIIENIRRLDINTLGEKLETLQESSENLPEGTDLFLSIDKFNDIVGAYLEPVHIDVIEEKNCSIIIVKAMHIVVSEVLQELEDLLFKDPSIEEIRFHSADVMLIDRSLEAEVWRGKNIRIETRNLKLDEAVVWDVSGKDNNHKYPTNAGTGIDGHGLDGTDGFPGESGGNVVILSNKVEGSKQFTIKSNGGKGSKGQDGGDGKNGKDGKGITESRFKIMFPPARNILALRINETIRENISFLEADMQLIKTDWKSGNDFYKNAIMKDGCEIQVSLSYSKVAINQFILFKGSQGQLGGDSGNCGFGGQGGYAGNIKINISGNYDPNINNSIHSIALKGEQGEHGRDGSFGEPGKNGWDMGLMDFKVLSLFDVTSHWPKYFGLNEKSKILLEYSETGSPSNVYFKYKENFVAMKEAKIEHKNVQRREERQNTRQNNDLQHHAQAQRKKNMSESRISTSLSPSEQIQDLRSNYESKRELVLNAISDSQRQEQSTSLKQEFKFTRLATRNENDNMDKGTRPVIYHLTDINETDKKFNFDEIIIELTADTSLEQWSNLNKIELDLSQLDKLFINLKRMRIENRLKLLHVESLLNDKYRIAVLQEISKLLRGNMHGLQNERIESAPENVAKYLIESNKFIKATTINKSSYGKLSQYLSKESSFKINKLDDNILKPIVDMLIEESTEIKKLYGEKNPKDEENAEYNEQFLNKIDEYLKDKGLLSRTFMRLLAMTFELNIIIYKYESNELKQIDNHNPEVSESYYLVHKDNDEFEELNINENYVRLDEYHRRAEKVHDRILSDTEMFRSRKAFIDYLQGKPFLDDHFYKGGFSEEETERPAKEFPTDKPSQIETVQAIMEYFTNEEASEQMRLESKLKLLTLPCFGHQRIMNTLLKRFAIEGRIVSIEVFYCLISLILETTSDNWGNKSIMFCWIICAHSQKHWMVELIILHIQNHLKMVTEQKLMDHLAKVRHADILLLFFVKLPNESVSMQCVEEIFYLLSKISTEIKNNLNKLVLSEWPFALKTEFWQCWVRKLEIDWQLTNGFEKSCHYLFSIENIYGKTMAFRLMEILEENKRKLTHLIVEKILMNFYNQTWSLTEDELIILANHCDIEKWMEDMENTTSDRSLKKLIDLMRANANSSSDKITKQLTAMQRIIVEWEKLEDHSEKDIIKWAKNFKQEKKRSEENIRISIDDIKKILPYIDRAIELKRKFTLRDTQKLAILSLNEGNTLAQVSTGEGKSLIVVALSVMKALCGQKVDIITSSSVLARRDAECNQDLYKIFSINASHNCSELIGGRKIVYSSNEVVYGDISSFQRDYLLDRFYNENLLGDRKFENLIVDEVDSMLLDRGNNLLYLSHNLPNFDKLQSVYIFIWQWINCLVPSSRTLKEVIDKKKIKQAVLGNLYDLIKVEDIREVDSELSEEQIKTLWNKLIELGVIDNRGQLLKDSVTYDQLPSDLAYTSDALNYLFKTCRKQIKWFTVPNQLRRFIEDHLDAWINNAFEAFLMKPGEDYVIDYDRIGASSDLNPNIIILDRDTGTDQGNSEWEEGLHQFLQLKHGCKLSMQSLKAVFISNVSYFKLYKNLYGLTGTLGSESERDLLKKTHQVEFVTVPTAKAKQFVEQLPIVCNTKEEWTNMILTQAADLTRLKKRSVLIICETVRDVETLYKAFRDKHTENVHVYTYTRDYEEFEIIKNEKGLQPGRTIIATNIAGRGTDIKLSEELSKSGGLHVCLSYLPKNLRIEQQAFGRAARSGESGTGQFIIWNPMEQQTTISVLKMKYKRDVDELYRISYLRDHYENQINTEEECFNIFRKYYQSLKYQYFDQILPINEILENSILSYLPIIGGINAKEDKMEYVKRKIVLDSLLDKWTFWLDEHYNSICNVTDEDDKKNLYSNLHSFLKDYCQKFKYDWLTTVKGNPTAMIKSGIFLMEQGNIDDAIKIFDEVIKCEPHFSEAAHYYKGCALINQKPENENDIKQEFGKAAKLFEKRGETAIFEASLVEKILLNTSNSIIQINGFVNQQKQIFNLYRIFCDSIDKCIGRSVVPQDFHHDDFNELEAKMIFDRLLDERVLIRTGLRKYDNDEELELICSRFCISVPVLRNFLTNHKWVHDKQFYNDISQVVKLPNRWDFWQELLKNKIITHQVEYVAIDEKNLEKLENMRFLKDISIEVQILNPNNSKREIFFDLDWLTEQHTKKNKIYRKEDITRIVEKDFYEILVECGVLSESRKANLANYENSSVTFSSFDSIRAEDFEKVNISLGDADHILLQLVNKNVLVKCKTKNTYRLAMNFDDQYFVFPSIYENAVKGLLHLSFAYRIEYETLLAQLKLENDLPIRLNMLQEPHRILIESLSSKMKLNPIEVTLTDEKYNEIREWENSLSGSNRLIELKRQCFEKFSNEKTWKWLVGQLKAQQGFRALEVPKITFELLRDKVPKTEFDMNSIDTFHMNSLSLLLKLGEKPWTWSMILRTAVIMALGVAQIALGTVVSNMGLIFEGLGDLMFATGAIWKGHCNWSDYATYKMISLSFTVMSLGFSVLRNAGRFIEQQSMRYTTIESMDLVKTAIKTVTIQKSTDNLKNMTSLSEAYEQIEISMKSVLDYISDKIMSLFDINTIFKSFEFLKTISDKSEQIKLIIDKILSIENLGDVIKICGSIKKSVNKIMAKHPTDLNDSVSKMYEVVDSVLKTLSINKILNSLNKEIEKIKKCYEKNSAVLSDSKGFINELSEYWKSKIKEISKSQLKEYFQKCFKTFYDYAENTYVYQPKVHKTTETNEYMQKQKECILHDKNRALNETEEPSVATHLEINYCRVLEKLTIVSNIPRRLINEILIKTELKNRSIDATNATISQLENKVITFNLKGNRFEYNDESTDDFQNIMQSVSDHIIKRFKRFFVFAGKKQWVSENLKIKEKNLFIIEVASQYQDFTSQKRAVIAAHIITAGTLIPNINEPFKSGLNQDLTHKEDIPRWVYAWNGIGFKIDQYQMSNWGNLDVINFQYNLSKDIKLKLNEMKVEFISQVKLETQNNIGIQRGALERAAQLIEDISPENLFELGKEGYNSFCHTQNQESLVKLID